MLLNRRFDDAEVKVSLTGQQDMADTYTLATQNSAAMTSEEKKKRDGITPIIYACATMWHENKQVGVCHGDTSTGH